MGCGNSSSCDTDSSGHTQPGGPSRYDEIPMYEHIRRRIRTSQKVGPSDDDLCDLKNVRHKRQLEPPRVAGRETTGANGDDLNPPLLYIASDYPRWFE